MKIYSGFRRPRHLLIGTDGLHIGDREQATFAALLAHATAHAIGEDLIEEKELALLQKRWNIEVGMEIRY